MYVPGSTIRCQSIFAPHTSIVEGCEEKKKERRKKEGRSTGAGRLLYLNDMLWCLQIHKHFRWYPWGVCLSQDNKEYSIPAYGMQL